MTNVIGTVNLLNAARHFGKIIRTMILWLKGICSTMFLQMKYTAHSENGLFTEDTPYDPHSPYSASKASSDHMVRSYHDTYKLPVVISNCSNNYGSYQFPEKLIPLCYTQYSSQPWCACVWERWKYPRLALCWRSCDSDWYHFSQSKTGTTYNIGGHNEWKNIDLIQTLCGIMDKKLNRPEGTSAKLITL